MQQGSQPHPSIEYFKTDSIKKHHGHRAMSNFSYFSLPVAMEDDTKTNNHLKGSSVLSKVCTLNDFGIFV